MKFTYTSGSRPIDGYTVKRGIGHGGFGEVYYAVSDGGKEVALKLVMRNLDVELRGVAQCMNLKHPNLVTLYDLRTNDAGEHWVVMEYVSGPSLSEMLDAHPDGFSLDEVNRWLHGICSGIGYLHERGIVHRDLKPGNVFIEDGTVKIGDYGLSKFITASRRSGQTESVGTVHYMAPEISRGKYDREIDVYATGVILYEMITGHVPFDGESVGEILMKHLTAQADVSKLPAPYDGVVARALAKDPVDRYRTMEQLSATLNGRAPEPAPAAPKETLAYPPHPTAPPITPPRTLKPATPSNWFDRVRAKVAAWYGRPWGLPDYVIAIVLLVLVGTVGGRLLQGMAPVIVPGLVTAGVILLVLKAARKPPVRSSPAGPVILDPVAERSRATEPPSVRVRPAAVSAVPEAPAVRMTTPRPYVPVERPIKPARARLAEAASAMLLTTVMSVIASVFAAGLMGLKTPAEFALLTSTCLGGCWFVVIPAKVWESQHGDVMIRRLVMGALGLGIGIWCSYLDKLLQVGWLNDPGGVPVFFEALEWMPGALKDATFFGLVFMLPRWWALAESRRGLRFNPWLVIAPCFWAWLISLLWSPTFSEPTYWGVVVTGLVAAIVQLAAPWEDPAARRRVVV